MEYRPSIRVSFRDEVYLVSDMDDYVCIEQIKGEGPDQWAHIHLPMTELEEWFSKENNIGD